jgi:hypothetical protein
MYKRNSDRNKTYNMFMGVFKSKGCCDNGRTISESVSGSLVEGYEDSKEGVARSMRNKRLLR